MREFQETMEYKEYISKSQMRLTEIQASMKTYYSKDVVKLSEEIDSLKKEIFKR